MRAGNLVRSYADDRGTRLAPRSRSGLPWMRPQEQAQRKASYPDPTRRLNSGSRLARPAKTAAATIEVRVVIFLDGFLDDDVMGSTAAGGAVRSFLA